MKPLSRWNAPLRVPHVVALGLLLVLSMLVWFSAILPRLDAALGPLQEGSPFAYEVLRSAIAFLMLPGACILPFIALYCYQRRWDRMRSQSGRREDYPPASHTT